jgi:hypothetical protein
MSELKTCFKRVDYDLSNLLNYIEIGDIGLPDIQRPFVWSNAKVRDLFDSMYRGFPVGYLLFWENAQNDGVRQIGVETKKRGVPARLIVDGQQRDWEKMAEQHALPSGWENLSYSDFLNRRREAMAEIIRRGFETLS